MKPREGYPMDNIPVSRVPLFGGGKDKDPNWFAAHIETGEREKEGGGFNDGVRNQQRLPGNLRAGSRRTRLADEGPDWLMKDQTG